MRSRHRGSHMGLMLLASQVFQMGLGNIPPVTLAVLGLNVYLFLKPASHLLMACVSVQEAYWRREWRRLLLSPVHHVDDWHLYFNMASFLWKGVRLERRMGSPWFAYLLAVFSLLTGVVYLMIEMLLTELTQDSGYSTQCAVGFSGVLFALKVLSNHYDPGGVTYVMGFPVANRYASWAELVLIHVMSPRTSFVGHLAGILVGLLYTAGPLKTAMESCAGFVTSNGYNARHFNNSGYSGSRGASMHPQNDHLYTSGLSEEEQYEAAVRASLNDTGRSDQRRPPSYGFNVPADQTREEVWRPADPTLEEVRRRRLQRFDRSNGSTAQSF